MMKDLLLVLGFLFILTACVNAQNNQQPMNAFDFEKAWKEVVENENKGLPESALKVVNEIAAQAKAQNNASQLVKAIIHQLKFTDAKEEDAFVKNLVRIKDEAQKASRPVKPLLHSLL